MQEVRARGLVATTFVAPAFLGGGAFWWDEVDWPVGSDEGDRFRARALAECGGWDLAVRSMATTIGYGTIEVPAYARCITEPELREIAAAGSLSIGAHTWSHANLAALDDAMLESELLRPLEWLRDRFAGAVPWLAYPYGLWSPRVVAAARRAGYTLAVRVDGGWLRGGTEAVDVFTVPRYNVAAGLSSAGFMLRASGMFCQ
jgi:peptidoglycan/xylan/chitin deacetylase (PgdA/CDA1 family)